MVPELQDGVGLVIEELEPDFPELRVLAPTILVDKEQSAGLAAPDDLPLSG
jgi:hypothetical protein